MTFEEKQNWSVTKLIERFEGDIVYDAHGFTAKFERSHAQKELTRRGQEVLRPIIDHLNENMPESKFKLDIAWAYLLNQIEVRIDPDKTGPQKLADTKGWIKWAKKFA